MHVYRAYTSGHFQVTVTLPWGSKKNTPDIQYGPHIESSIIGEFPSFFKGSFPVPETDYLGHHTR